MEIGTTRTSLTIAAESIVLWVAAALDADHADLYVVKSRGIVTVCTPLPLNFGGRGLAEQVLSVTEATSMINCGIEQ